MCITCKNLKFLFKCRLRWPTTCIYTCINWLINQILRQDAIMSFLSFYCSCSEDMFILSKKLVDWLIYSLNDLPRSLCTVKVQGIIVVMTVHCWDVNMCLCHIKLIVPIALNTAKKTCVSSLSIHIWREVIYVCLKQEFKVFDVGKFQITTLFSYIKYQPF